MIELVIFTAGVRTPEQGKYAEFMASPDEEAIDDYIDTMKDTVDEDWEIVKNKKYYHCISTEPTTIYRGKD